LHHFVISNPGFPASIDDQNSPPDQLVENLDKLLYLFRFSGDIDLEEREGRGGSFCIEIQAARLEKPSDDEDVEQGVCIFEKF
jgi:hypothetical protein